jgi:hypothetical protein
LLAHDSILVNKLLEEYARMPLDKESEEFIFEIDQHVLLYEYDEAVKKIQSARLGRFN